MRAVGYRQLWAHLEGEYTLEEAVSRGIAATRQLAKRQLTWLRADESGQWLDPAIDRPAVVDSRRYGRGLGEVWALTEAAC